MKKNRQRSFIEVISSETEAKYSDDMIVLSSDCQSDSDFKEIPPFETTLNKPKSLVKH